MVYVPALTPLREKLAVLISYLAPEAKEAA